MSVTVFDKLIECDKAVKGPDYIKLYKDGAEIASFEGIADFSGYSIIGGEWSLPKPSENERITSIEDAVTALMDVVMGGM